MKCVSFFNKYANPLAMALLLLLGVSIFDLKNPTSSTLPDATSTAATQPIAPISALVEKPITPITTATPKGARTTSTTSCDAIIISGRTICIFNAPSLATNPGTGVASYQNQFLFGHNTSTVFGSLGSANSFQIIKNGQTESYKIVKKVTYCDYSNVKQHGPQYDCANFAEPRLPTRASGHATDYYEAKNQGYDFILMTCAGQPIGKEDATLRLLAYAIRV